MYKKLLHRLRKSLLSPHDNRNTGFSLVEILVVLALIGALTVPLIISYNNSRNTQALRASSEELANLARSAHVFAREANEQKGWGVARTSESTYSLISGQKDDWEVFASRQTESGITIDNDFFVWFDISSGETDTNYFVQLSTSNGIMQTVVIYNTGLVEIQN